MDSILIFVILGVVAAAIYFVVLPTLKSSSGTKATAPISAVDTGITSVTVTMTRALSDLQAATNLNSVSNTFSDVAAEKAVPIESAAGTSSKSPRVS